MKNFLYFKTKNQSYFFIEKKNHTFVRNVYFQKQLKISFSIKIMQWKTVKTKVS